MQASPKATIVVAEDSEPLRYAMRRFFQLHGFNVLEAADGANALALVAGHVGPVDFVVTDYRMPRMDGLAFAERLKAERPDVPVLFVSATDNEQLAKSHPEVELMRKPVELDALLARIRESVEHRLRLDKRKRLKYRRET